MNATPRQTTAKRHQRIGIVWLLAAVLTLAAGYTGYRLYLAHKIKVKIGQIRQTGFPVTTAELNNWYTAVSPEENAAITYTNAFAQLQYGDTNSPFLPFFGKGELPPRTKPLPEEMRQAIASLVQKNSKALELLYVAASQKKCRYPVDLTEGFTTRLPHLIGIKRATQLLTLKTLLHRHNKEFDAVVESVKCQLAVSQSLKEEPIIISYLVNVACQRITVNNIEGVLAQGSAENHQLIQLIEMLRDARTGDNVSRPFVGEVCNGINLFSLSQQELARLLTTVAPEAWGDYEDLSKSLDFSSSLWLMRVTGWLDRDQLFYLNRMEEYLRAARLPFPARLERADEIYRVWEANQRNRIPFAFSKLLISPLGKVIERDAHMLALSRAAEFGLGIERYRRSHGNRLPETSGELVPEFFNTLPIDPFDGQPLRYKKLAEGYVAYSVGSDREDNGGKERMSRDKSGSGYDLTFTVAR